MAPTLAAEGCRDQERNDEVTPSATHLPPRKGLDLLASRRGAGHGAPAARPELAEDPQQRRVTRARSPSMLRDDMWPWAQIRGWLAVSRHWSVGQPADGTAA